MNDVLDILKPDYFFQFAIICKRYDCIKLPTNFSFQCLNIDIKKFVILDLNELTFVAYVLVNKIFFQESLVQFYSFRIEHLSPCLN